ncbi:MAG: benzoyl-CoA 2,3-epoxidase subunit BoxB, partial [Myxococcota bacterium]
HLWAMVYLLHSYFGRDGREEAAELLTRRSGDPDRPRILGAFNEPTSHWLSFFMFTMFTDRDGKYQLSALSESGFDPLARTCKFMLTEEAHHMFVGETGIQRVIDRACQLMKQDSNEDVRALGGIDLPTVQKYLNLWYTVSLDLFGGEISSNAADAFASGIKGRHRERRYEDHSCLDSTYMVDAVETAADGSKRIAAREVPMRNAMNEILRRDYIKDCQRGVDRWNKTIAKHGIDFELRLPSNRFHRAIGAYSDVHTDVDGNLISDADWQARRDSWLPSAADEVYIKSLMKPVTEMGKIANWIAPPLRGINGQQFEFEYVRSK